jgi:hypothetical protein
MFNLFVKTVRLDVLKIFHKTKLPQLCVEHILESGALTFTFDLHCCWSRLRCRVLYLRALFVNARMLRFALSPEILVLGRLMDSCNQFCRMQALPLRLTSEQAQRMAAAMRNILRGYSKMFVFKHEMKLFRITPKFHLMAHGADYVEARRVNLWVFSCWAQEDLIGKVMRIVRDTNNCEQSLERWYAWVRSKVD